jgi:hypothetical protein
MDNHEETSVRDAAMHRERIELKDGRYLIYYTFDASLSPEAPSDIPAEQEDPATAEKHV